MHWSGEGAPSAFDLTNLCRHVGPWYVQQVFSGHRCTGEHSWRWPLCEHGVSWMTYIHIDCPRDLGICSLGSLTSGRAFLSVVTCFLTVEGGRGGDGVAFLAVRVSDLRGLAALAVAVLVISVLPLSAQAFLFMSLLWCFLLRVIYGRSQLANPNLRQT